MSGNHYAPTPGTATEYQPVVPDGNKDVTGIRNLTLTGDLTVAGQKQVAATELTIASGAITATQSKHTIDTESDAATDDLDTISGIAAGEIVQFSLAAAARNVVIKHGTGNINCPGGLDIELDADDDNVLVIGDADADSVSVLAVGAAAISSSGLLVKSGTIAAAAVATLNATPVELIPAPGAGRYIEVAFCEWFLDFGTVAYDAAAVGDTLGAKYTNGSGVQVLQTLAGNGIGAAAADYHALVQAASTVLEPVANAAIVAHIDTGEWYAAAGDSPLKYRIHYRVRTQLT